MTRISIMRLALLATVGVGTLACTPAPSPGDSPPTTTAPGATNPLEVIAARRALMIAIEDHVRPIDTATVEDHVDPAELVAAADSIAAMLLAFPHLFPATTNLYESDAEIPVTLALPKVWEEFPAFYAMTAAASRTATSLAETTDAGQLREASRLVRASCDSCHARYLRPYVRSKPVQGDDDFDFDALFQPEP